ncbi:MAG: hypothetical protein JW953_04910 [Anaerolineae bacterium]|nr:hypothetical protein [Anaerolineae bacterium]
MNGQFSLKGIVVYREAMPVWQYFVLIPLLLIWNFFWFRALAPLDGFLAQNVFSWLPDWFFGGSLSQYSRPTLLATFFFLLLTTGIAAPIVEINYLVIDTRNWLPGRKVLLAPTWIEAVSWPGRQVYIDLAQETIKNSPEYDPSTPINEVYEERLYDFYGRPRN